MKTYAIWKDREVVDYIKLTEEQAAQLNSIKGIGIYFGFDSKTNPEKDMFKINLLNMLGKQRKNSIFFNFSIAFLKNSCYH